MEHLDLALLHLVFKIAFNEFNNIEDLTKESTYKYWNYWNEIEYDKETYKKFCKRHLILVNHIHDRTMIYLHLLIESNQCKDLPKVDAHFDHREY